MSGVEERGRAIADRARRRLIVRVAARLRTEVPDRIIEVSDDGVTVSGRGVLRDPRLVWIGSMLR